MAENQSTKVTITLGKPKSAYKRQATFDRKRPRESNEFIFSGMKASGEAVVESKKNLHIMTLNSAGTKLKKTNDNA